MALDPDNFELVPGSPEDVNDLNAMLAALVAAFNSIVGVAPAPGDLKASAAIAVPLGWLVCEGQAVSRSSYPALFEAIGTFWGPGNGSSTFNVPDLRGRMTVGIDEEGAHLTYNRHLGLSSGYETYALKAAELAIHTHGVGTLSSAHQHDPGTLVAESQQPWTAGWNAPIADTSWTEMDVSIDDTSMVRDIPVAGNPLAADANIGYTPGTHSHAIQGATAVGGALTGDTGSVGSGNAHENMPPYAVVRMLVKS